MAFEQNNKVFLWLLLLAFDFFTLTSLVSAAILCGVASQGQDVFLGNKYYTVAATVGAITIVFAFALPCMTRLGYFMTEGVILNFRGRKGFPCQSCDDDDTMCGNSNRVCWIKQFSTLHWFPFLLCLFLDIAFLVAVFVVGGEYVFGDDNRANPALTNDIYVAYVVNASISAVAVLCHMMLLFSAFGACTGCDSLTPDTEEMTDSTMFPCTLCGSEMESTQATAGARYQEVNKTFAI